MQDFVDGQFESEVHSIGVKVVSNSSYSLSVVKSLKSVDSVNSSFCVVCSGFRVLSVNDSSNGVVFRSVKSVVIVLSF